MTNNNNQTKRKIGSDAAIRHTRQGGICRTCVNLGSPTCDNVTVKLERWCDSDSYSLDLYFEVVECDQFQRETLTIEDLRGEVI